MTNANPVERARACALRELAALAEHSPCIASHAILDEATALLAFDLPYLTRHDPAGEPRVAHGFELGVALPPGYPFEAPRIHFLSPEPIFHPAILASLPFVCVGHHAWSPDVGAAHFVALHVQVVVGAEPIDTLDAFHGDANSSDAARHWNGGQLRLVRVRNCAHALQRGRHRTFGYQQQIRRVGHWSLSPLSLSLLP